MTVLDHIRSRSAGLIGNLATWLRKMFRQDRSRPPVIELSTPSEPELEPEPIDILPTVEPKPKERRQYSPGIRSLRNQLTETVTSLIEQIAEPNIARMFDRQEMRDYEEALSYLNGCDFHYVDELTERLNGGSEFTALRPDDDLREAIWPVDIAVVTRDSEENGGSLQFSRLFAATPASLRGRAKIVPQRAAWLVTASVKKDGVWYAQKAPIGLINKRWVALDDGIVRNKTDSIAGALESILINDRQKRAEINDTASVLQSLALTERYNWHVAIGQKNGPRVLLPTNPHGCLELFKTREKREGETRRAALRHWVHNHFRETSDREIAYVRDHLRGTTEFNWRGFDACEIFVSEFDLEKNELFKQQAAEWRAKRTHNRVAVRIKRERR